MISKWALVTGTSFAPILLVWGVESYTLSGVHIAP